SAFSATRTIPRSAPPEPRQREPQDVAQTLVVNRRPRLDGAEAVWTARSTTYEREQAWPPSRHRIHRVRRGFEQCLQRPFGYYDAPAHAQARQLTSGHQLVRQCARDAQHFGRLHHRQGQASVLAMACPHFVPTPPTTAAAA